LYDRGSDRLVKVDQEIVRARYATDEGNPVVPDPSLSAVIEEWRSDADSLLGQQIGFTTNGVERRAPMMGNWVTDAWLWAYPHADIALTNWAGFRAAVDTGAITLGEVVAVMPFENRIIEVAITGEQLKANLECCGGASGGMTYTSRGRVRLNSNRSFHADSTYYLLINDFMYAGGDGYRFAEYDPDAYQTGIDWRQPVIEWISALNTTEADPLDNYLDDTRR